MTFTEFFITYLAVGAPFGVYYFLKHRGKSFDIALLTKSSAAALLWFLFAGRFLRRWFVSSITALLRSNWNFSLENKIDKASRNILGIFATVSSEAEMPSFFEFRETLERYIGLTVAAQHSTANSRAAKHESEVFRVIGYDSRALQLAEKIIHRTNYLRLKSHQSLARRDFLQVCWSLKEKFSTQYNDQLGKWQQYQTEVMRLFALLEDDEAIETLLNRDPTPFAEPPRLNNNNKQEPDLWRVAIVTQNVG